MCSSESCEEFLLLLLCINIIYHDYSYYYYYYYIINLRTGVDNRTQAHCTPDQTVAAKFLCMPLILSLFFSFMMILRYSTESNILDGSTAHNTFIYVLLLQKEGIEAKVDEKKHGTHIDMLSCMYEYRKMRPSKQKIYGDGTGRCTEINRELKSHGVEKRRFYCTVSCVSNNDGNQVLRFRPNFLKQMRIMVGYESMCAPPIFYTIIYYYNNNNI